MWDAKKTKTCVKTDGRRTISMAVFLLALSLIMMGCSPKSETTVPESSLTESQVSISTSHSSDADVSLSIYDTPDVDGYIHNVYKLGTEDAYKLPYESLEEAKEKGKTILTMADAIDGDEIESLVNAFNVKNDKYHIEREVFDQIEKYEGQSKLKIEIAAGKGPDIIIGSAMTDASKIMDKGCFIDLAPLIEASGIKDEYYFHCYKALTYENHVYGVTPSGSASGRAVKKDVIGGKENLSFDEFVDAVLNYPQDAVFINDTQKPEKILEYFLEGSENLWGMIDWDNQTCNFNCELFYKILDIVKRYNNARNKGYEPIMKNMWLSPGSAPGKESFEKDGFVTIDYWFDDGNFPIGSFSMTTIMVNSKTEYLEGAWDFISFCLSPEGQSYVYDCPVRKDVYDLIYEDWRALYESEEEADRDYPMSQIADYKDLHERAKYAPYKIEPIITIIEEEAGAYWNGSKSKEEVAAIVQSRVFIYVNE